MSVFNFSELSWSGVDSDGIYSHICSRSDNQALNVPIGGKVPDVDHLFGAEEEVLWSKEHVVSAQHKTGDAQLQCDG